MEMVEIECAFTQTGRVIPYLKDELYGPEPLWIRDHLIDQLVRFFKSLLWSSGIAGKT